MVLPNDPEEAITRKKSYDAFSDFEILAFSEMGHNSAHFESGLTTLEALKLTQEGPKNF